MTYIDVALLRFLGGGAHVSLLAFNITGRMYDLQ